MNAEASHVHRDYTGAKVGMWLFLYTEVLLFGGMFLVYSIYRTRFPMLFHKSSEELSLALGAVNTVILLTSSLTMAMAITAVQRGRKTLSLMFQGVTIAFGFAFLVNKYFEWTAKFEHGIYIGSPGIETYGEKMFYSLYYVMTGLHGLHVLIGVVLLLVMLVFTVKGIVHRGDFVKLENSGLYWHLVDIIWIFLFPLFYLIV
jgi:cytochrome c oxidase subunit 3